LKDWSSKTYRILAKISKDQIEVERRFADSVGEVTTGETLRYFRELEPLLSDVKSREIVATTFQGADRAEVLVNIKNVTPIPAGARPSQLDMETRLKGKNFKYIVVRDDDGWKIAEVWAVEVGHSMSLYTRRPPLFPMYVGFD
jgi:hypothetical protein